MIKHFMVGLIGIAGALAMADTVEYKQGDQKLEGYVAKGSVDKKMPGILIVHDWMGLGDYQKAKADQLAKKNMVAFAVDIYGKDVRPKATSEAKELTGKYKGDRALLRSRIRAAYDTLVAMPEVDPNKIFVMGYCFGGTTALELARSGAKLAGTISFHGGLSNPTPQDAKNIRGDVLVLHGADDPAVPPAEVDAFKREMKDAKKAYTFVAYPGAVHAFTNPAAGSDNSKGAAYNENADKKSWLEFEQFINKHI